MQFNSVTVMTKDIQAMTAFYQAVLRAEIDDTCGGPDRIEIVLPNQRMLTLCRHDEAYVGERPKLCLEFQAEDVDVEYRRLLALGIEVERPPETYPWGWRAFCLHDPDGNDLCIVCKVSPEN